MYHCGLNLNWIGIPDYTNGSITVVNLEKSGLDFILMPISATCYSVAISTLGTKKTEFIKNDKGDIEESIFSNLTFSGDHRYLDGAYGAKMNNRFQELLRTFDESIFV